MTPPRIRSLEDLERLAALGSAELYPAEPKIIVGTASCGRSAGAREVLKAARDEVRRQQLDWRVTQTGCIGWCSQEPLLDVWIPGRARVTYGRVSPEAAQQIVRAAPNPLEEFAIAILPGDDNALKGRYTHYIKGPNGKVGGLLPYKELPLFRGQVRVAMRNCGLIDPRSLEEYTARGGYSALWHALRMRTPQQLIEEIGASNLRERSGGGAEVGPRWQRVHDAAASPKCVLCSLDAGSGCADRCLLESDPHGILEGLIIGAYAMGASQGIIHIGEPYGEAAEVVGGAIRQAKRAGLLGHNILDTGFAFEVRLVRGAEAEKGCREESAVIHAIEESLAPMEEVPASGARRPACLSAAETWANVPVVTARGGAWFAGLGTARSKGTKIFAVRGPVSNPDLVELALGTTLARIVQQHGGGLLPGRECKGVRTGGAAGGFVAVDRFELPADYESLAAADSTVGGGEIAVLDERTCMVEATRSSLASLQGMSCGRCVCCRAGVKRLIEVLDSIRQGRGKEQDVELLEDLGWLLRDTSGCERGRQAALPVLSALRYFRSEFLSHVRERRCPARACRDLITFEVDPLLCDGCGECVAPCGSDAIIGEPGRPHLIAQARCNRCGACLEVCDCDAVMVL